MPAAPVVEEVAPTAPHVHSPHPSRCCEEEHPSSVLAKLRAAPPKRMGTWGAVTVRGGADRPAGHRGEPDASYQARLVAWGAAIAREEAALGGWPPA